MATVGMAALCSECFTEVLYEDREVHIYERHLQKQLFTCPDCDYFSTHDKLNVDQHITEEHPQLTTKVDAISHVQLYSDEIRDWNGRCWPESVDYVQTADLCEIDCSGDEEGIGGEEMGMDEISEDEGEDAVETVSNQVDFCASDETRGWYCHVCEIFVAGRQEEHIYRVHLNETLFKCPLCEFSCKHSKRTVHDHIAQSHKDSHPPPLPISLIDNYRNEIAEWSRLCWDNERSELASPPLDYLDEEDKENCRAIDELLRLDTSEQNGRVMKMEDSISDSEVENRLAKSLHHRQKKFVKVRAKRMKYGSRLPADFACDLCNTPVRHFEMRTHVFKAHLCVTDLFHCSECSFSSDCNKQIVQRHIYKKHRDVDSCTVISRLSEFKTELAELERHCWPKSKRSRQNEHEWLTCAVCGDVIKSLDRRRHVLRHHLRLPNMYSCLHCPFTSSYLRDSVVRHSNSLHGDPNINNRLEEMREKLNELMLRCFPLKDKPQGRVGQWAVAFAKPKRSKDCASNSYCLICRRSFGENSGNHVRRYHMPFLYQSAVCAYSAVDSRSVEAHLRSHHAEVDVTSGIVNNSALYAEEMVKAYRNCFKQMPSVKGADQKVKKGGGSTSCRLCKLPVKADAQVKHIYEHHLAVNDLFKCSACDFESAFDEDLVSRHTAEVHHPTAFTVSKTAECVEKVNAFAIACFNPNVDSLSKRCETAFDIKRFCSKKKAVCTVCEDGQLIARHRMKEHIWKVHMPHLPFKCPFCEEHRLRPCDIKDHIRRYHRKQKRAHVVNKTDDLKEQFFDQFKRCFCS